MSLPIISIRGCGIGGGKAAAAPGVPTASRGRMAEMAAVTRHLRREKAQRLAAWRPSTETMLRRICPKIG
jgi:hypothetical protein